MSAGAYHGQNIADLPQSVQNFREIISVPLKSSVNMVPFPEWSGYTASASTADRYGLPRATAFSAAVETAEKCARSAGPKKLRAHFSDKADWDRPEEGQPRSGAST
jgi:hypothetical protein